MTSLTPTQTEIVKGIAMGMTVKAIAQSRGVTPNSIYDALTNDAKRGNSIRAKLGTTSPVMLTHYAIAHGLVKLWQTA